MSPRFHVKWIGDDNVPRSESFHIYHRADLFRVELIHDYGFPPEKVRLIELHDSNQILSRAVNCYTSMGMDEKVARTRIEETITRIKPRRKLGAYHKAMKNLTAVR